MIRGIILALPVLAGCTVIAPENEFRVTEYDGRGWYMTASGVASGCRVVQHGEIDACVVYTGKRCEVRSPGCDD